MSRIKLFSNFVNENYGTPTFMKLGDRGPAVQALQQSMENLGFHLPKFGIDSKFGPETFGVAQTTINTVARLTNLAQIVNDPNVDKFNNDGLTKVQYNILNIIGHNPQMISQIRAHLGSQMAGDQKESPAVPSSGTSSGDAKKVIDFFKGLGYSSAGAAGIAGNLKTESQFKTSAVGDGGLAKSLAQWHPDRFKELTNKGFNLMDFGSALAAIDWELKNNYPNTYAKIKNATDPTVAAQIFDKEFERSAGTSTAIRMRDAASYHEQFA